MHKRAGTAAFYRPEALSEGQAGYQSESMVKSGEIVSSSQQKLELIDIAKSMQNLMP